MPSSKIGHLLETSRQTSDNFVFRLHYRVTVVLLLTSALALLWKINYGDPISCLSESRESQWFLNDYCWYEGTYTVPTPSSERVGTGTIYPGLSVSKDESTKEFHRVHRWVVIAVLVQAAFFYLPHIIWRTLEGRLAHQLIWNTDGSLEAARKDLITNYLKSFSYRNLIYVGGLFLSEILNLINVVVQIILVSLVLQTSFPSLDLVIQSGSDGTDVSAQSSFPLQTKCDYYKYGPSGIRHRLNINCLVTINGVMESVFICQWIWFVLLAHLSVLALIYRVVTVVLPPFRVLRLASKASLTSCSTVKEVVSRLGIGEYFVLYMLSKNLDPVHMKDILEGLADDTTRKQQLYPLTEIQD